MKKILVVEDESVIRMVLKILLKEKGHMVHEASNGEIALSLVEKNQFDLILMDLHMPVMSGYKTIKTLREKKMDMFVVAITASMTEEDKNEALELGFDDCILKNFDDNFNNQIDQFLGRALPG
ncbi:response regulator transcription factor [Candidatus Uabimicrobium sp. HlEnr_7]|uniref:response regulator transcription factor n=1 Tax=Candidatus Uabimicrobium helgolandensis TaxID=3095367 RepID=UPI003558C6DD